MDKRYVLFPPLELSPTILSFVLLLQEVGLFGFAAASCNSRTSCYFLYMCLSSPHLIVVLPVPLVQQGHIVAHADQGVPQQLQLRRVNLGGDGAVAIPGQAEIGAEYLSQRPFTKFTKTKTKTLNLWLPILLSVGSPRLCGLGRLWVRPPALSTGRTQGAGYNLLWRQLGKKTIPTKTCIHLDTVGTQFMTNV